MTVTCCQRSLLSAMLLCVAAASSTLEQVWHGRTLVLHSEWFDTDEVQDSGFICSFTVLLYTSLLAADLKSNFRRTFSSHYVILSIFRNHAVVSRFSPLRRNSYRQIYCRWYKTEFDTFFVHLMQWQINTSRRYDDSGSQFTYSVPTPTSADVNKYSGPIHKNIFDQNWL